MNDETVAQTTLNLEEDGWYFVSTMFRESSAAVSPPPWYSETLVWSLDKETKERGRMYQYRGDDGWRSHAQHARAVQWVIDGMPEEDDQQ